MITNLLAEMQKDGFRGKRVAATRGGEWQGPCILPGCNGLGKDRLRVQPGQGTYGYFECRVCNSRGSLVDYLMMKRGYNKLQALAEVGWQPKDGSESIIPQSILAKRHSTHDVPCEAWQIAGKAFIKYCVDILWSEQGKEALEYLRARGLKDETIKVAQIGYNPAEMQRIGRKWGSKKPVMLYQGIVIPWFIGDDLWRITIRDEKATSDDRYKQVTGGSNGLYLASFLHYDRPVVLVEGEIDALSVAQEAGHEVVVCATGSTEGSHTARWLTALATKILVLVAFDAEEKGDKAAQWWLDRLENAHRLRPLWDDANQMLQDGIDLLNGWILPRIDSILYGPVPMPDFDDSLKCYSCGRSFPDFEGWDPEQIPADAPSPSYDLANEQPYCRQCRPDLFESVQPEQDIAQWNAAASKELFPKWLTPGTWDWNKQVERNGIDEMMARRQIYLDNRRYVEAG
jgi:hypothetical protein